MKNIPFTNLAQAFLKAAELEQSEDSISVTFDDKSKDMIIPVVKDLSLALDEVDTKNVIDNTGLYENEDDEMDYE